MNYINCTDLRLVVAMQLVKLEMYEISEEVFFLNVLFKNRVN